MRYSFYMVPQGKELPTLPAVWEGMYRQSVEHALAFFGTADLAAPLEMFPTMVDDADRQIIRVIAVRDDAGLEPGTVSLGDLREIGPETRIDADALVARIGMELPLGDNTNLAESDIVAFEGTDPELLRAMAVLSEQIARTRGRSTIATWTEHRSWGVDGDVALDATVPGEGSSVRARHEMESPILDSLGYTPVHSEWLTMLDVDSAADTEPTPVPGYEVVTFRGPTTPPELREELAAIYALANTDMPSGEMEIEAGIWDAERVVRKDERLARSGIDWITTAVRAQGGDIVGWTTLVIPPGNSRVAYQSGTLIRSDHRGRGLGSWIKRVNLRALREEYPEVRSIPTWTDGDNAPVIAMNVRLGFQPRALNVGWQKKL